eukprot:CAMPEP_0185030412 /NCGR_PEP_ID=MMETSP1103-20130426/17362_1 /TAXON_ID=36769 /ORGANISM="Paraphysomonas bandaiensis, Strain Caron Lab Isolate" /LENGTH=351 /DNA_ID=CAMNT_0027565539 /DNA_START=94 /DNA_END=1146 /DNA_ORIENTATION=-
MNGKPSKTAVYIQKTKNHDLEFRLVELTTVREMLLSQYQELDKAISEKRKSFDNENILAGMRLLNEIREITFDVLEQIIEWQKMFVKVKRPTLLNGDYLLEMIKSTEFVNSSPLRKYFNFAVFRRNVFLLPLSTGKPKDPVTVPESLAQEVQKFSNPDMDKVIAGYTLFQKCLPSKIFKSILSLDRWAYSVWVPNIEVSNALPPIQQQSTPTQQNVKKKSRCSTSQRPKSSSRKISTMSTPVLRTSVETPVHNAINSRRHTMSTARDTPQKCKSSIDELREPMVNQSEVASKSSSNIQPTTNTAGDAVVEVTAGDSVTVHSHHLNAISTMSSLNDFDVAAGGLSTAQLREW